MRKLTLVFLTIVFSNSTDLAVVIPNSTIKSCLVYPITSGKPYQRFSLIYFLEECTIWTYFEENNLKNSRGWESDGSRASVPRSGVAGGSCIPAHFGQIAIACTAEKRLIQFLMRDRSRRSRGWAPHFEVSSKGGCTVRWSPVDHHQCSVSALRLVCSDLEHQRHYRSRRPVDYISLLSVKHRAGYCG